MTPDLKDFELYEQGSVYNWPTEDGGIRIVVNLETEMDEDFNEVYSPVRAIIKAALYWLIRKQTKPDLLDLEDISPGHKLQLIGKFFEVFDPSIFSSYETRISGVKKCGDPPFMTEAMSSLEEISNDPKEDDKIRWTASEV